MQILLIIPRHHCVHLKSSYASRLQTCSLVHFYIHQNKKSPRHLNAPNHRREKRDQMRFSGMETSVREIPLRSRRMGDLSFFACAQLHVLLSPNRGICSCFVIPHLSQLCNASSSPCQPIASKMETTGKYRAGVYYFLTYLVIFNVYAAFSVWITIACKAYCLHCMILRNIVHRFVIIMP